jgi:hypothetical protein
VISKNLQTKKPQKNGYGVVGLTAHNASLPLVGKPEKTMCGRKLASAG